MSTSAFKKTSLAKRLGSLFIDEESVNGLKSRVPVPRHGISSSHSRENVNFHLGYDREKIASVIRTKGMSFTKAIAGAPKTKMELKQAPIKLSMPKQVNQSVVNPNKGFIKGDALTKNASANPYIRKILGSGKGVVQLGRGYIRALTGGNVNIAARDSFNLSSTSLRRFKKLDDAGKLRIANKMATRRGQDYSVSKAVIRQAMNQRDLAQIGTASATAAHLVNENKKKKVAQRNAMQNQWRYR